MKINLIGFIHPTSSRAIITQNNIRTIESLVETMNKGIKDGATVFIIRIIER